MITDEQKLRWRGIALRTLVPYFDWFFDAPMTAYRADEKKSFCISATVRVMVKVECGRATEGLDHY